MSCSGRGGSVFRVVGYEYEVPGGFSEAAVEAELQRAKDHGPVTEFDTGRGTLCWFNGRPGDELRAVRDRVVALLGPTARAVTYEKRGY